MNEIDIKKIAAGYGVMAFGFVAVGSLLAGATVPTIFIRGVEAFAIFGMLAWAIAGWVVSRNNHSTAEDEQQRSKGEHLDETA